MDAFARLRLARRASTALLVPLVSFGGPLAAQAPTDSAAALIRRGELKVQNWSIHGPSPMILLVTEAPSSASRAERSYRHQFTQGLSRWIAMRGYSYFVLVEPPDTTGAAPSPEEIVARLEAEALAVSAELRRRGMPVIAVVGLADGAVAAARIVAHDSTPPYALALLAPSLPPPAGASGARLPRWDDVLAFPDERSPGILAIQSYCDGPLPQGLGGRHPFRRRLVLLAGVDPWLAYSDGRSCPHEISSRPRVPSLDPLEMVAEWLLTSIHFPE